MARRDDDFDDDDYTGFDTTDPDDDATIACPHCGEEVYEDAVRCSACGEYVTDDGGAYSRKPTWVLVGLVICALIVLFWIVGGL